jgi:hypothetical protein
MNQIIRRRYVSDNGTNFTIGVNSELTTQTAGDPAVAKIGDAGAGLTSDPPFPVQGQPRSVVAYNPAGRSRTIVCLTADASLYAVGQTIDVEDSDGASTTYTVDRLLPERLRKRRKTAAA